MKRALRQRRKVIHVDHNVARKRQWQHQQQSEPDSRKEPSGATKPCPAARLRPSEWAWNSIEFLAKCWLRWTMRVLTRVLLWCPRRGPLPAFVSLPWQRRQQDRLLRALSSLQQAGWSIIWLRRKRLMTSSVSSAKLSDSSRAAGGTNAPLASNNALSANRTRGSGSGSKSIVDFSNS